MTKQIGSKELFESAGIPLSEEEAWLITHAIEQSNAADHIHIKASLYSAKLNEKAFREHAEALSEYAKSLSDNAESANRYTASLRTATWVLAIVTGVLAFGSLALFLYQVGVIF